MADVTIRTDFGNRQVQVSHYEGEFTLTVLNKQGEEIVNFTTDDWRELENLSDALQTVIRNYWRQKEKG